MRDPRDFRSEAFLSWGSINGGTNGIFHGNLQISDVHLVSVSSYVSHYWLFKNLNSWKLSTRLVDYLQYQTWAEKCDLLYGLDGPNASASYGSLKGVSIPCQYLWLKLTNLDKLSSYKMAAVLPQFFFSFSVSMKGRTETQIRTV